MDLVTLTEATFDETVAASELPVLVDFAAAWCPPCRLLRPVLRQLASESAGRLVVAQVDADASPALAARFDVMAMPTLILFIDGQIRHRLVGARSKAQLVRELAEALTTAGSVSGTGGPPS